MSGKKKHVPIRMCIVCRAKRPKLDLLRLALDEQSRAFVDEHFTKTGRGAYVCRECLEEVKKDKRLEKAFLGRAIGFAQEAASA